LGEATRIIYFDWLDIRIIGLLMFDGAEKAQAMPDAGAVSYVTKSGPAKDLIDVIRKSICADNEVAAKPANWPFRSSRIAFEEWKQPRVFADEKIFLMCVPLWSIVYGSN
jgi:DNA-binding NarL/FixJ family response regulator